MRAAPADALGPIARFQKRRSGLHAPLVSGRIALDLRELDGAFGGWRAPAPLRALAVAARKLGTGQALCDGASEYGEELTNCMKSAHDRFLFHPERRALTWIKNSRVGC